MKIGKEGYLPGSGSARVAAIGTRPFWLPRSARLAVSHASSIIHEHESFAHDVIHLPISLAYFARSASPFHWTQLPFYFRPESEGPDSVAAPDRMGRAQSSVAGSPSNAGSVSLPHPPETLASTPPSATRDRRTKTNAVRPKMQLSIFRPIVTAASKAADSFGTSVGAVGTLSNSWRPVSLAVNKAQSTPENSPPERPNISARRFQRTSPQFQDPASSESLTSQTLMPRLKLGVSRSPRREVPGGFPSAQNVPIGFFTAQNSVTESAQNAPGGFFPTYNSVSETEAAEPLVELLLPRQDPVVDQFRAVAPGHRSRSQTAQSAATPARVSESQGAIAKLIERSVIPAQLPGLELRLIDSEEHASSSDWEAKSDWKQQRDSDAQADGQTITPAPSQPAPPLNINEVADKVHQTLMRRQQLERERKGFY